MGDANDGKGKDTNADAGTGGTSTTTTSRSIGISGPTYFVLHLENCGGKLSEEGKIRAVQNLRAGILAKIALGNIAQSIEVCTQLYLSSHNFLTNTRKWAGKDQAKVGKAWDKTAIGFLFQISETHGEITAANYTIPKLGEGKGERNEVFKLVNMEGSRRFGLWCLLKLDTKRGRVFRRRWGSVLDSSQDDIAVRTSWKGDETPEDRAERCRITSEKYTTMNEILAEIREDESGFWNQLVTFCNSTHAAWRNGNMSATFKFAFTK